MNPRSEPAAASGPVALRPATPADAEALVGLIHELADFEQLTHLLQVTPEALQEQLFGNRPAAEAMVAELPAGEGAGTGAGELVAFALWFTNFSTFLGRPGLYLEDLYVRPAHRGRGLGRRMLRHLAGLAVERGCGRFEWSVLDWNRRAIGFYQGLGATVMPDWRICRLAGEALAACADPTGQVPLRADALTAGSASVTGNVTVPGTVTGTRAAEPPPCAGRTTPAG